MQSFFLCRLPFSDTISRHELTSSTPEELSFGEITVHPWPGLKFDGKMEVCPESTPETVYKADIKSLVAELRANGGKTVVCRQICGTFDRFEPEAMAREYFALFPEMFCFLFCHPLAGCWMGASPELLLTTKAGSGHAETRALAGTRKRCEGGEWSAKNLAEHRLVTDDMCRRIEELTLEPRLGRQYNFAYGNIEHLCTPIEIEGDLEGVSLHRLIRAIHPTPAVGGYPREKALSDIDAIEHWPRNCYGGHISVRHGSETIVYVALRCVHFDAAKWAVYTGSGITSDSEAADEWLETEAKAAPLLSILSHYSSR